MSINEEIVKILDEIDIKEVVKDTASIIKDVSTVVSKAKDALVTPTQSQRCGVIDAIKYKLEDFKYWCQLRLTDVEFCYNMAKAELQVHNLSDYCKCSIIMMMIFILVHMIGILFTITISC
jgi:hypothetical protein